MLLPGILKGFGIRRWRGIKTSRGQKGQRRIWCVGPFTTRGGGQRRCSRCIVMGHRLRPRCLASAAQIGYRLPNMEAQWIANSTTDGQLVIPLPITFAAPRAYWMARSRRIPFSQLPNSRAPINAKQIVHIKPHTSTGDTQSQLGLCNEVPCTMNSIRTKFCTLY